MNRPLREEALDLLTETFSEPSVLPTRDGKLYRWILSAAGGDTIRLTLDSPEFNDLVHIVVSDPKAVPRVTSSTMRSIEELREFIRYVKERLAR